MNVVIRVHPRLYGQLLTNIRLHSILSSKGSAIYFNNAMF